MPRVDQVIRARGVGTGSRLALFVAVAIVFAPGHHGSDPHGLAGAGKSEMLTRILLPTFDEAALRHDRPGVLSAHPAEAKRPGVAVAAAAGTRSAAPLVAFRSASRLGAAPPSAASAEGPAPSRGPPHLQLD